MPRSHGSPDPYTTQLLPFGRWARSARLLRVRCVVQHTLWAMSQGYVSLALRIANRESRKPTSAGFRTDVLRRYGMYSSDFRFACMWDTVLFLVVCVSTRCPMWLKKACAILASQRNCHKAYDVVVLPVQRHVEDVAGGPLNAQIQPVNITRHIHPSREVFVGSRRFLFGDTVGWQNV